MTISARQDNCLLVKFRGKLYSKAFHAMFPMFMLISAFFVPQPTIHVGTQASTDRNDFQHIKRVGTSDSVRIHSDARGNLATKSKSAERRARSFTRRCDDDATFVTSEAYPPVTALTRESVASAGLKLVDLASGLNWAAQSDALWSKTLAGDPATAATLRAVGANTTVFLPTTVQAGCEYNVKPPKSALIPATGRNGNTFRVETDAGCPWNVQFIGDRNFIKNIVIVGAPTVGGGDVLGPHEVKYDVGINDGPKRGGDIEITVGNDVAPGHPTHHVDQDGIACTYAVSPPSAFFPAQGSPQVLTGNFNVTTTPPTGCPWTAVNNNPEFITITSGGSGNGNGTVHYSVAPNPGNASRMGTITVQGETHTITQDGTPPPPPGCTFTVSPAGRSFPDQGPPQVLTGNFNVTTTPPTGCPWTAVNNNPEFITITSGGSGNGSATVNYSVAANPGNASRTGTITVQGETHTITQDGAPPPPPGCTFAVSPPAPAGPFPASAGTGSFAVTTTPPTGCPWTAVNNNPAFITITSGGSGDGSGTVNYSVAANPGNASRTGTITVQGATHTITQLASGDVPGCTYEVKPPNAFVGEGKGSFGFTVKTTPDTGCTWTPKNKNPEFITLISGTKDGSGTAIYSVEANANADKLFGEIAFQDQTGQTVQGQTHSITQAAAGGCDPEHPEEKPKPEPIMIGQTIYGTLSDKDCRSRPPRSALRADRYEFTLTEARKVAINVASADFDPFIILLRKIGETEVKIDDDGAGFSSSRLPPLPASEEFTLREAGTYIVEVTSFATNSSGNYAALIASEGVPLVPAILAVIRDGKTLIVIGENFADGAKLFIGDSTKEEKDTTNDRSRSRTAVIALRSAKKVKKKTPITLRLVNPNGKESDVFVYQSRP